MSEVLHALHGVQAGANYRCPTFTRESFFFLFKKKKEKKERNETHVIVNCYKLKHGS